MSVSNGVGNIPKNVPIAQDNGSIAASVILPTLVTSGAVTTTACPATSAVMRLENIPPITQGDIVYNEFILSLYLEIDLLFLGLGLDRLVQ